MKSFNSFIEEVNTNQYYKEIEFVCVNPNFENATDPDAQKLLYRDLCGIKGVICLWQNWDHLEEGQKSLSAIYQNSNQRKSILKLAKKYNVDIDLEQDVSKEYAERARNGQHEGQII